MDLGISGRWALVCGASKGLGRGCAEALVREGVNVVITARGADVLEATARELRAVGRGEIRSVVGDITTEAGRAAALAACPQVDILVNNAGGPPPGGFDALDDDKWHLAHELNLMSTVRLIRGVLPHMREQGWGRIVTVASSSIKQPIENLLLSNTYRVAILGLAKSLAIELAPDGILINTVGPGRIATDRVAGLDAGRAEKAGLTVEEVRAQTEKAIPLGRYGTAEEFGKVAAFLVSGANTYTTGQHFLVDGAMVKAI